MLLELAIILHSCQTMTLPTSNMVAVGVCRCPGNSSLCKLPHIGLGMLLIVAIIFSALQEHIRPVTLPTIPFLLTLIREMHYYFSRQPVMQILAYTLGVSLIRVMVNLLWKKLKNMATIGPPL